MATDTPFEIVQMQSWMIPKMAELQVLEYGGDVVQAEAKLRNWFDSEFPRSRGAIVLVGVSGDRVIALQTYSPWPYALRGRTYRTLQSGATLVHPDFRGRKIFQRMLVEGTRLAKATGVDFFVGFPVQMSYGGFIKDHWTDLGPLRWWTKPLRPIALALRGRAGNTSRAPLGVGEPLSLEKLASFGPDAERFQLTAEADFLAWRYWGRSADVRYFELGRGKRRVGMALKLTDIHGFRELLVGRIHTQSAGPGFVASALLALSWAAYRDGVAAVSTALLRPTASTAAALALGGFIPNKQTAPLIVKPLATAPEATDVALWRDVCLEDIDTW